MCHGRLDCAFVSTAIEFNDANLDMPYYQSFGDVGAESQARLVKDAQAAGVVMLEHQLPYSRLLSAVTEHSIPIVLVDMPLVDAGCSTPPAAHHYVGHFLLVVGYDATHAVVHNQVCRATG